MGNILVLVVRALFVVWAIHPHNAHNPTQPPTHTPHTQQVAKFEGHSSPITALSFSENGYYLATSAADGVKLWDLRKLKNFKSLEPYEGSATTCLAFDSSGHYLAVGGKDARVYGVKQDWAVVTTLTDVPAKVCFVVGSESLLE